MASHPLLLTICLIAGGLIHLLFARPLPSDTAWLVLAGLLLAFLYSLLRARQRVTAQPVAIAMLTTAVGFGLFWVDSQARLADRLDAMSAGQDVTIALRIADFVGAGAAKRFAASPLSDRWPRRLRLTWLTEDVRLEPGDCWLMTLRLRQPRGFANPVSFDYERWLFLRRIGASGYVRHAIRMPHCDGRSPLMRLRKTAAERIESSLPVGDARAVLLAVTLGARHELDRERWERFAITGTSHLMAISGLHVALASFVVFSIARGALCALSVTANQRTIAFAAALGFAGLYALLSGFAVPARRAMLMLFAALLPALCARPVFSFRCLGAAAIVMVVLAPLTILETGFALSFGAVSLLLWLATADSRPPVRRNGAVRYALQLIRLQWVLLLGMLPLIATFFGRLTWTAPLVNLLVVPVFNLVALPAAIVGSLTPGIGGDIGLQIAHRTLAVILDIVDRGAALPMAEWPLARPAALAMLVLLAAALCGVLPRHWPARFLSVPLLIALAWQARPVPPVGCVDLDVLDVGQGFAAVLRTHSHTMVYDAGPRFRSGSDTGQLVVLPFLHSKAVRQLDTLLLSHADLDHSGGAASIISGMPVGRVMLPAVERSRAGIVRASVTNCVRGLAWSWDGVAFEVLHPGAEGASAGNEASCVLQVTSGDRRLLLTGDIGQSTERQLVHDGVIQRTDLVAVPHHGSLSSSSAVFIERTAATYAIAAAGYANRWKFPREEVVLRWQAAGSELFNTATDGATGFRLCPQAATVRYRHRRDRRKLWTAE